jgi:hypothetical protein
MYTLGKFLQATGLVLVPLALFYGIAAGDKRGAIAVELGLLGAGACVFLLGRFVEGRAGR